MSDLHLGQIYGSKLNLKINKFIQVVTIILNLVIIPFLVRVLAYIHVSTSVILVVITTGIQIAMTEII